MQLEALLFFLTVKNGVSWRFT